MKYDSTANRTWRPGWTEAELNVLRNNRTLSVKKLLPLLPGRTEKAVHHKRLKAKLRKCWLYNELEVLRTNTDKSSAELVPLLPGRARKVITMKRKELGWPYQSPPKTPKGKYTKHIQPKPPVSDRFWAR
ncbi:hypothetical protein [Bradyrhizobium erythrophlei]|uniref:Uncharacterized protein n=1 Tax=Bradyrhizobium erythrophlei TaxID=1437360 RepID=A0A1M5PRJ5_9BRAD|nr:hypothetical protein [Bradyrhizobium erythrophlei]SHH04398.1 hypothetical protein SAMN05443248_3481 [Bradyrhizobium erythrophlei]